MTKNQKAKAAAWILGACAGLAVGSLENKIAPRKTVYPTAKRMGVLVAGVFALEFLTTGVSLVAAKKFQVDPSVLFED
jgi:hypothetical protein